MKKEIPSLDVRVKRQIRECLNLVEEVLGKDLLGVYVYGSAILGGLQKYSDLDLFVVVKRSTTQEEKSRLVTALLKISGKYMKSTKLPIEMTIVQQSELNPWRYPPRCDFQYGEWLRQQFELGHIDPFLKEMPDLALLVTQVLLASRTPVGANPDQLLCEVPYKDFMTAIKDVLFAVMSDLESDVRNVVLTLARIWSTVSTDEIRSKPAAADWVLDRLPERFRPVMERAKAICKGEEQERWDDIQQLIQPCADYMFNEANDKIAAIMLSGDINGCIKIY
jgi:streptomycin 3"-adenylyltransferase